MNKIPTLLISTLLFACNVATKENQAKNLPDTQAVIQKEKDTHTIAEINKYLPKGFEVVQFANQQNPNDTDLNDDGISDYIVLMARGVTVEELPMAEDVRLAIFEGQDDGNFLLKSQTGNLVAFANTTIMVSNSNVINLAVQSMRHEYKLKFRYESNYQDYVLIGSEYNNYASGMGTGVENISTNFIAGERIAIIDDKKKITHTREELYAISEIDDDSILWIIGNDQTTTEIKSEPIQESNAYTFDNFWISKHKVGIFSKRMSIADVYDIIPKEQIKRTKGVGEFAEDIFDVFEIYDANGEIVVVLVPEIYGDDNSKIRVVHIEDKRFETVKGIGLNSTFGELAAAHAIDELSPDLEHIVVEIKTINTSFAISKTELQEGWFVTGKGIDESKIPNTAKFDSLAIVWL